MRKIVTSSEMARVEELDYKAGASEEDFMEKAGSAVADSAASMLEWMDKDSPVILLCGKGNNAADAYVAGRKLMEKGREVIALQLGAEDGSRLLKKQRQAFQGRIVYDLDNWAWPHDALLIDGIFGTGFHGDCQGAFRQLIEAANASRLTILAIDVPSGLNGSTGELASAVIKAEQTLCLGLPKLGCFLGAAWNHVGRLFCADFGLSQAAIDAARADALLLEIEGLPPLPEIVATRHKYQAGYVQILAGSRSMPGAGILAAHAALRTGAGLVQLLVHRGMENALETCPAEVIRLSYEQSPAAILSEKASVLVGPGMGRDTSSRQVILETLKGLKKESIVIDADALNALSDSGSTPPRKALLTPHHGEMHRLLNSDQVLEADSLNSATQRYCDEHEVSVILKGGPTWIFEAKALPRVSPVGNPGMATAGTGDVLAGMLVALISQGMSGTDAAELGVYLHGLAGDLAAVARGTRSLIASDIIDQISDAYRWLDSQA